MAWPRVLCLEFYQDCTRQLHVYVWGGFSYSVVSDSLQEPGWAHQAPLSVGFSRQKYWSELPFPPSRDLPHPGIKHRSALQADSLLLSHRESPIPGICWHPFCQRWLLTGGGAAASCKGHPCFWGHFKNHELGNFPGLSSAFPMLKPRMELCGHHGCDLRTFCLMEVVWCCSLWIGER